jgi:CorA-like Mg2+ transporter protein
VTQADARTVDGLAGAVRVVECRPGEAPREIPAAGARSDGEAVLWFDVDVRTLAGRDPAASVRGLRELLAGVCSDLDDEMLEDLLDADYWPKRRRYGNVRAVSAAGIEPSDSADARSFAGSLTFQIVEMLAGEGWLVTCWHPPRTFTGSEEKAATGELGDHQDMVDEIEQQWAEGDSRTAGDLGLIVLDRLVDTYPDVRRSLFDWLEAWELDLYRRCDSDAQPERRTLIELRALVFQVRKAVAPLNAARGKAATYWFGDVSQAEEAERIDDRIDRALAMAGELSDRLRSALDLVQLQLAQVAGRRTERLQQKFEIVASVLLVPTLIAGTYGANTKFPGLNEGWGTVTMLVLMLLGGLGTFFGLRAARRREARRLAKEADEQAASAAAKAA